MAAIFLGLNMLNDFDKSQETIVSFLKLFTHEGLNKMANILQMKYSHVFSSNTIFVFDEISQKSLFLGVLYTDMGSQLDKPRLFLVATNRVHVNIAVIINAIVLYILVFMYLLEIKLLLLLLHMLYFHGRYMKCLHKYFSV